MSHFCLLQDLQGYTADDLDLSTDQGLRTYWLDRFAGHFDDLAAHALESMGRGAARQISLAKDEFLKAIEQLRTAPPRDGEPPLNILRLNRLREDILRRHRITDPYKRVKEQETSAAIDLYPQTVKKLHLMDDEQKWLHLVQCVFAGNAFDLGAVGNGHTSRRTEDFLATLDAMKPRPWLVDDFDALLNDLLGGPPAKWARAVVFVDNAGSDFVLGLMPFVRELALAGTQIVLAANERAALNDMTVDETVDVVEQLAAVDLDLTALIDGQMIEVVSTGSSVALLDLSEVSDELNEAAQGAELVIVEGMGRAVESNFHTRFSVDSLKLALIKDPRVASRLGGQLHDCVCKYETIERPEEEGEPENEDAAP